MNCITTSSKYHDDDDENNEFNFEKMIGIHLDTSALNCLFTNDEIKKMYY